MTASPPDALYDAHPDVSLSTPAFEDQGSGGITTLFDFRRWRLPMLQDRKPCCSLLSHGTFSRVLSRGRLRLLHRDSSSNTPFLRPHYEAAKGQTEAIRYSLVERLICCASGSIVGGHCDIEKGSCKERQPHREELAQLCPRLPITTGEFVQADMNILASSFRDLQ